jgi:hypothetical protein
VSSRKKEIEAATSVEIGISESKLSLSPSRSPAKNKNVNENINNGTINQNNVPNINSLNNINNLNNSTLNSTNNKCNNFTQCKNSIEFNEPDKSVTKILLLELRNIKKSLIESSRDIEKVFKLPLSHVKINVI